MSSTPLNIGEFKLGEHVRMIDVFDHTCEILIWAVDKVTPKTVTLAFYGDFSDTRMTFNESTLKPCFRHLNDAIDYRIKQVRANMDQFVAESLKEIEELKQVKS